MTMAGDGTGKDGYANDQESTQMIVSLINSSYAKKATPDIFEIDTARAYCSGRTEELLGRVLESKFQGAPLRSKLSVASKANPIPGHGISLRPDSVIQQMKETLIALKSNSVDIFYLHMPDHATSIEKTLEACQGLYEKGCFKELGLSNYASWQVVQIWHICEKKGWVKPTVYQGMYNGITRDIERELIPALRAYDIRFYAYNPLAGGLLAGSYSSLEEKPTSGRFATSTEIGKKYQERYWKEEYFTALNIVRDACNQMNISMSDAAIRWLVHHSQLRGANGDGIIIGSRKVSHIEECLKSFESKPLPASVVEAFDKAWNICRPFCPSYAR